MTRDIPSEMERGAAINQECKQLQAVFTSLCVCFSLQTLHK